MKLPFTACLAFGLVVCPDLYGQTVLSYYAYSASDTAHVMSYPSNEWPYDTSWVVPVIWDERANFDYPTIIEVHADDTREMLLSKFWIDRDSLVTFKYYRNGQLSVRNVSDRGSSLAWRLSETYHPNGQLHSIGNPSTDTLELSTVYYANGQREREFWYYAGRAFNDWTEWYENGQVKLEAHYEPGPLTEAMKPYRESMPIGEWRYYKPNGELDKIEVYEEGKLIETITK